MSMRQKYIFKLYICGNTIDSYRAINNLHLICREQLIDEFFVEIIDVLKEPLKAEEDKIIATPTLIKKSPLPLQCFVGDMSNKMQILLSLNLVNHR